MCCYFNLGIDSEIGISVERQRTKYRCCNKILYFLSGLYHGAAFKPVYNVKEYISAIKQKPANRN
jgi:hypothetical protein